MEDNNQDAPEVQETQETNEETVETTETTGQTEELTPEQIADLKKKADASSQNFERAKKAEEALRQAKGSGQAEALSPKDTLALYEHKVSSEDYDEVVRVSKALNKPISEALKDPILKTILEKSSAERKTANATATGPSTRGANKLDGDTLLRKAEMTGEVPDSKEGMDAIVEARMKRLGK